MAGITGGLTLIAISFAYIVLLILTWIFLPGKPKKKYLIKLSNDGNVNSNYQISIFPYNDSLRYRLTRDGLALVQVTEPEPEEDSVGPASQAEQKTSKPGALQKREVSAMTSRAENATASGRKAIGLGGTFASFLGILGSLIPGKAGVGLKARASQIRSNQALASRKLQAPALARNRVRALQSAGGQLAGEKRAPAKAEPLQKQTTDPEHIQKETSRKKESRSNPAYFRTIVEGLAPSDAVGLELTVIQKNRRGIEPGMILTLESLQQPVEESGVVLAPVKRQIQVNFPSIPMWRKIAAAIASLILTVVFFVWMLPLVAA